ncbi:MAG: DUF108 domain-containing protein [Alphaproteobacteria bacterium]|nr:DUF108 domain-containing protein [Alphaproteobacteria bacterium]
MPVVSIIGNGRIARPIRGRLDDAPGWALGRVLVRRDAPDIAGAVTGEDAFFSYPADLIIDAAGPAALRQHGLRCLAHADLWTIGTAALADDGFRQELEAEASRHDRQVRLFSNGLAAPLPRAEHLYITIRRPGLDDPWSGPLRDAVLRHPDELNSAVAAALAGPGVDKTRVTLEDSGPGGEHALYAEGTTSCGRWKRSVHFISPDASMIHPVSAQILEALRREIQAFRFD